MAADDHSTELLPFINEDEPIFDVGIRGYDKRQVDSYVARAESQIAELKAARDTALATSADRAAELASREAHIESLRQQAAKAAEAPSPVVHVSERIREMLQLATKEADQTRQRRRGRGGRHRGCIGRRRAADARASVRAEAAAEQQRLTAGCRASARPRPTRSWPRPGYQAGVASWTGPGPRRPAARKPAARRAASGSTPRQPPPGRRPSEPRRDTAAHRRGGLRDHPAGPANRGRAAGTPPDEAAARIRGRADRGRGPRPGPRRWPASGPGRSGALQALHVRPGHRAALRQPSGERADRAAAELAADGQRRSPRRTGPARGDRADRPGRGRTRRRRPRVPGAASPRTPRSGSG